jgi:hypothetical protein
MAPSSVIIWHRSLSGTDDRMSYRLAQREADRRGVRLIYLKMMVSSLVQNNRVIAELPKEGSCDVDIEPRTPQFGALLII